jgi:recombinational DNA repair protein (RecF pathway)
MNKFSRDEFIIIRITDYKDHKSIVKALGRRSGLISFSVNKHKNFKSKFTGKINKLNIINAELFHSEKHLYLSNINQTIHAPTIKNMQEYQNQQKLLMLLEKISQYKVENNIYETIYKIITKKLSLNTSLPILLCKIMHNLNIFEQDKRLHQANHLYINNKGIINNKEGPIKISTNTYKIIQFYIQNKIELCQRLKIHSENKYEIEFVFTHLLQTKYNTLVNFRNLNDIFNNIQLHNQTH